MEPERTLLFCVTESPIRLVGFAFGRQTGAEPTYKIYLEPVANVPYIRQAEPKKESPK